MQVGSALTQRGWEITVAAQRRSELLERARVAGLDTVDWPFYHDFDISTLRASSRWIKEHRPDAILVTTARDMRTVGVVAKRHGVPVVWRMGPKPKNNLIHRLSGMLISRVIAPSVTVKEELQKFSWLRDKITVIPNGIEVTPAPSEDHIHAARAMLGVPPGALLCLYVGRIKTGKGVDTLIDAFALVRKELPRAILWMVGADVNEAIMRHKVKELGLDDVVSFRGYDSDPSAYFAACDLFVLPSRYESFSYVLLEAMLNAKPCITTSAGAIPEVVGDAAMVIQPNAPTALAAAIVQLLNDPDRRRQLGDSGRRRVTDHFNLSTTIDAVEALFNNPASTQ